MVILHLWWIATYTSKWQMVRHLPFSRSLLTDVNIPLHNIVKIGKALLLVCGKYFTFINISTHMALQKWVTLCIRFLPMLGGYWFWREHMTLDILYFVTLVTLFNKVFWTFNKIFQNLWVWWIILFFQLIAIIKCKV